ncbi:MAG TPA: ABC transporter substrate-binding protein [Vicinamibacterales bacterium]
MMRFVASCLLALVVGILPLEGATPPAPIAAGEELLLMGRDAGRHGGRLVVAVRAEPRTLNPAVENDTASRDVLGRMGGDLIHINRQTQLTEPALASSWTRSKDGREYTLSLRKGVRFSDGHPFDADDVLFTLRVILDERIGSSNRELLIVGGKPIEVKKIGQYSIRVTLAEPYAAAERIFDSISILPRHLLERAYLAGTLQDSWTPTTPPSSIAGLGPYRLKEYVAGQRLVLERNPYYWKADSTKQRLPYLDELVFLFTGNEDAQVIRFQSGESDVLGRAGADNFNLLSKDQNARRFQLVDLGPSLEYNFLFFNLNDLSRKNLPQIAARQRWFTDLSFRRAVSRAIDREAVARLVYRGRGLALWGNVTPGNRLWMNASLPHPSRSVADAKAILKSAGYWWRADGALLDRQGQRVEFTIATSATSTQRTQMATLIQADLKELGMDVRVVPIEFRALLERVFESYDFDASVFGLGGGDADPNGEMNVWMSSGSNHLWHLGQSSPATPWEAEIDRLMQQQLATLDVRERKRLYDRVQAIIAEQQPFIFLATPNVLVGARSDLANFQPSVLDPYTLWNVEQLYFKPQGPSGRR